jgi:MYXO-CTERM domain-containing protein
MKKLFLLLVAMATFNANAAIISVTTDKAVYNVGDTVTATVSISDLFDANSVQTVFSGYTAMFTFDQSLLELITGSTMSLSPFGPFSAEPFFTPSEFGDSVGVMSAVFNFSPASQFGRNDIGLFTVNFIANAIGDSVLAMGPSTISEPFSQPIPVSTQNASFSVAQVPAPSTGLLAALALAGLALSRRRANA